MQKRLTFKEKYLVFVKKNKSNVNKQVFFAIVLTSLALWITYYY